MWVYNVTAVNIIGLFHKNFMVLSMILVFISAVLTQNGNTYYFHMLPVFASKSTYPFSFANVSTCCTDCVGTTKNKDRRLYDQDCWVASMCTFRCIMKANLGWIKYNGHVYVFSVSPKIPIALFGYVC